MEADILESKKGSISCPEVWRPIFWKVKRIYILSRSMEADILESKKGSISCPEVWRPIF